MIKITAWFGVSEDAAKGHSMLDDGGSLFAIVLEDCEELMLGMGAEVLITRIWPANLVRWRTGRITYINNLDHFDILPREAWTDVDHSAAMRHWMAGETKGLI